MIKKLFSFIFCLAPVGAMAATVDLVPGDGNGNIEIPSTQYPEYPTGLNIPATGNSAVIQNALNDDGTTKYIAKYLSLGNNGMNVANLSVGDYASGEIGWGEKGFLYIANDTASSTADGFLISSTGSVSIATLLRVLSDQSLTIAGTTNTLIDLSVGDGTTNSGIQNAGVLNLTNIDGFVAGSPVSNTGSILAIDANTVNMQSLDTTNGNVTVNANEADALKISAYIQNNITSGGAAESTKLTAYNMTVGGTIQNGSGTMDITMNGGNLLVGGSIENKSGSDMNITYSDASITTSTISVNGAITNEGNSSSMVIKTGGNLNISGQYTPESGEPTYGNASIVNGGNLYIDVGGTITLNNGFDISTMAQTNTLEIKTGKLTVGNSDASHWLDLFSNRLNKYVLNITNDSLNLGTTGITNGSDNNANANMTLSAQNVTAGLVTNNGDKLYIALPSLDNNGTEVVNPITGNITITGNVTGNSGVTTLAAGGTLGTGAVNNSATMNLSGEGGTTIASVSNSGTLTVSSLTSSTGNINIIGDVTNTGNATITSRAITIGGNIVNNAGNLAILGSDDGTGAAVNLGALTAAGGQTTLNALVGQITMNGNLDVTSGGLNMGGATTNLDVTGATTVNGDITLAAIDNSTILPAGTMNISNSGTQKFVLTSTDGITVGGNILATQNDFARTAQFVAKNQSDGTVQKITVGTSDTNGNITATGRGHLIFGDAGNQSELTATGTVSATKSNNNIGSIEFYGNQTTVGALAGDGLFIAHGTMNDDDAETSITATTGNINITDAIYFNNPATDPSTGLIIKDTKNFTLNTNSGSIGVGGIELTTGNTLKLDSASNLAVTGTIENTGNLTLQAAELAFLAQDLTNNGTIKIDAATIDMQDITNNAAADLVARDIRAGNITANANSAMTITSDDLAAGALDIAESGVVNYDVGDATFTGAITVNGNIVQGTPDNTDGALNIIRATNLTADSLNLTGSFITKSGAGVYDFKNNVTISGDISTTGGQTHIFARNGKLTAKDINNTATLTLSGANGIDITDTIASTGNLTLDSGTGLTTADTISLAGTTTLLGTGLSTPNTFAQNTLYQNYGGTLMGGDVNVISSDYTITASDVALGSLAQIYGHMTLNTSDLRVVDSIDATDLRVAANPSTTWLTVDVGGNVSGNTQFIGLGHMKIGGNYTYNSNSNLMMAILSPNDAGRDYWADISMTDDQTFGQITNRSPDAEPLISVGGTFITDLTMNFSDRAGLQSNGEMGVEIFDMIDQGTAIWLLNAQGGIREEGSKIRNIVVKFCNADGTKCFDYFKPAVGLNETGTDLPAYISVRDTTSDGIADSLYLVFDPRFGGPVEVFKIQPIVGRENDHTKNEYLTAGALDDMIAGGLADAKFNNRTPIEAIPVAFAGTNMETAANEIYKRMEYYTETHDGHSLARISRLFQPRETEQISGAIVLNEHTSFRDFEDHMLDEFIWNRNRNLRKAWGEFDFGLVRQNTSDDERASANRFSFTGGYDWQETQTLILGLAARVSHTSGNNNTHIDLSYIPGQSIAGNVDIDVADTDFGVGAYMLKNMGTKMRVYGNAFLDLHWLDVTRNQTYMSSISGDTTAFSLISEWGLMHDWLNQYIVGNAYARVGYNFGFSMTEEAAGDEYLKLKSDGYFIVTPGYTLTAQKRIYPSPWFQMRPYASVGVEYDVLGAPDNAKYKFAAAQNFTKYDIEIDPLWANIGGGMEFLSVTGVQVGLDYRYQYNADIQMHKIKLSGSYRF